MLRTVGRVFNGGWKADCLMAVVCSALAAATIWSASATIPADLRSIDASNVWFNADIPRVTENWLLRFSAHYRSSVHPLFSASGYAVTAIGTRVLSLDDGRAIDLSLSLFAVVWAWAMYAAGRLLGCGRLEAALITIIGVFSGTALFFFAVPETSLLASTSVAVALAIGLIAVKYRSHEWMVGLVSAISLSMTVTNWILGLIVAALALDWRAAVRASIAGFVLVTALWSVQKWAIPSVEFFTAVSSEGRYVQSPTPRRFAEQLAAFFVSPLAVPEVRRTAGVSGDPIVTVRYPFGLSAQGSLPPTRDPSAWIASVLALAIVGIGLFRLITIRDAAHSVILLFVAAQFALHIIYGNETFLYSGNWLPALLLIVASGVLQLRPAARVPVLLVLLVCGGYSNVNALRRSIDHLAPFSRGSADFVFTGEVECFSSTVQVTNTSTRSWSNVRVRVNGDDGGGGYSTRVPVLGDGESIRIAADRLMSESGQSLTLGALAAQCHTIELQADTPDGPVAVTLVGTIERRRFFDGKPVP